MTHCYQAKYVMAETEAFFLRQFDVCDDFLHAVEQAEDAREEGEYLVAVYPAPRVEMIQP